jgi:shikimate dehydrogenase
MRLFGLIGFPLGHSFSKKYFEEKFVKENLKDCLFELFPLKEIEDFKKLIENNINLHGLAVTIPYKETVIPYLTDISAAAKEIGAVNCIKFNDVNTVGFNTDVVGFEKSLTPLLKPHHTTALVLGTGGASKAVQFVLKKLGVNFLLVSRNSLAEKNIISYNDIDENIMEQCSIIINCTPLGMSPNENQFPNLPYQFITAKHLLYDLIYKPEKTMFLKKGEEHGATIKNGFEMLVLQAEENLKIWTAPSISH